MAIKEAVGVLTYKDEQGNKTLLYPAVKTDTTLTLAGEPADAAAVGTALDTMETDFEERISQLEEEARTSKVVCTCKGEEAVGVILTGVINGVTYQAQVDENGEAIFNVKDCGTFVISGTEEYKCNATVELVYFGNYYVTLQAVAFEYEEWLTAAGLSASSYADLDAVLADEKAVRTLMTKTASVEYMAEGLADDPEVAEQILNDIYVAKWVNYREYAYSSLIAVAELKSIMDASGKYGIYITAEKAVGSKALVPTLTSNTGSDGGTASASSTFSSGYNAYSAFDGNESTYWVTNSTGADSWIKYTFVNPTNVKTVGYIENSNKCISTFKIQGSNDGSKWDDLTDVLNISHDTTLQTIALANDSYYLQYRFYVVSATDLGVGLRTLQFYGNQLIPMVPTLTSNTGSDGGQAFASSEWDNTYSAWKAFTGTTTDLNDCWHAASGKTSGYIGYKFTHPVNVKVVEIINRNIDDGVSPIKTFQLQGSNDGDSWESIDGRLTNNSEKLAKSLFAVNNNKSYSQYRLNITDVWVDGMAIGNLQFYGTEKWQPKGLVPVMTSNTAPYGEVSASGYYNSSGYIFYPYYAFESDVVRGWIGTYKSTTAYIQYKFTTPTMVDSFKMQVMTDRNFTFTLQGSNDGTTYTNLTTDTNEIPYSDTDDVFRIEVMNNGSYYLYYKLNCVSSTGHEPGFGNLQFYGRHLEALVPPMTSNTSPVGEVSSNNTYSGRQSWWAFTGGTPDINTVANYWTSNMDAPIGAYLMYEFPSIVTVSRIDWSINYAGSSSNPTTNYKVEISTDADSWTEVFVGSVGNTNFALKESVDIDLLEAKYIRWITTSVGGMGIGLAQLYGAPDYDSRTYIYDHGVEVMELDTYSSSSSHSVEIGNDSITVTKGATSGKAFAYTANKINLSNYSLLSTVSGEHMNNTNNVNVIAVGANLPSVEAATDYTPTACVVTSGSKNELDITDMTEELYAVFGFATGGTNASLITSSQIWLE